MFIYFTTIFISWCITSNLPGGPDKTDTQRKRPYQIKTDTVMMFCSVNILSRAVLWKNCWRFHRLPAARLGLTCALFNTLMHYCHEGLEEKNICKIDLLANITSCMDKNDGSGFGSTGPRPKQMNKSHQMTGYWEIINSALCQPTSRHRFKRVE